MYNQPTYNPASGAYGSPQHHPAPGSPQGPPGVNIFNPAHARPRQAAAAPQGHVAPGAPVSGVAKAPGSGSGFYSSAEQGVGPHAPAYGYGQPGPGNPNFGFDGLQAAANSQAFAMGVGMGQEYLNANMKRYIPWFTSAWHALKYYFAVNHHYVKRKLFVLLFPFTKKQWTRAALDDASHGHDGGYPVTRKFQVPMMDENAPDLYIPLMAFVTYILVTGYAKGAKNSFTPEVLVEVTTACFVTQILEIAAIRLGLYMLHAPGSLLDLLAITGYKYVPLNINMLCGLALGRSAYFLALVYTGSAITYFALKTFAHAVKRGVGGHTQGGGGPIQLEFVVLGFSVLQFLSVWWLGYSRSLA